LSLVILISFPALGKQLNAGNFSPGVPNQYFPLVPGAFWNYSAANGETEHVEILAAAAPCHGVIGKTVAGVAVTVRHDTVFDEDGSLIEDTCDWHASDNEGNVWYLGEDAQQWDHGTLVGTEGSWEAGIDGAQAGIIMPAHPHPGDKYRQEFAAGIAEDVGQVIGIHKPVSVQAGDFADCVKTLDSSPLAPGDREQKYYCPGTGLVLEVTPRGGRERNEFTTYNVP